MGPLKEALNDPKLIMIKGVTHVHLGLDLGPIWYHSEPSTYFPHQFLGWDFFAASYSMTTLVAKSGLISESFPIRLKSPVKTKIREYIV